MEAGKWLTTIEQNNEVIILQPTHLVMALGLSGFAKIPEFDG